MGVKEERQKMIDAIDERLDLLGARATILKEHGFELSDHENEMYKRYIVRQASRRPTKVSVSASGWGWEIQA